MASFSNKKFKHTFIDTDNSDDDIEVPFPRFIVIEIYRNSHYTTITIIIENVISSNLTSVNV